MRTEDCIFLWVATPMKELQRGTAVGGNTRLRRIFANLQYLDNQSEQKLFGRVSNTTVIVRTDTLPDVRRDDVLYTREPSVQGQFQIDGEAYDDYGKGEFEVLSVVPSRVGAATRNPTTITAKMIT